ncbi:MAG: tyrosine--tRNA ligase, partial [Rubrobacter sp.]|nr:tyrosine--tRNA ligase [Rubrobacter sp.]
MFHGEDGEEAVADAEEHFDAVVRREVPEDAPEVVLPEDMREVWIVDLITRAGFAKTNGEARRLIRGGAVRLDGETIEDER